MNFELKRRGSKILLERSKKVWLICGLFGLFSLAPALAGTTNYYYDAAGRLIGGFRTTGDAQWYNYDAADNRTSLGSGGLTLPNQAAEIQAYAVLFQNQSISSTDGRFVLVLQGDGNLVLYEGSTALWASGTSGHQAAVLVNWGNGNLGLYDPQFNVLWQTNTASTANQGANLIVQTDGNLVLYAGSTAIWNSGTCCH